MSTDLLNGAAVAAALALGTAGALLAGPTVALREPEAAAGPVRGSLTDAGGVVVPLVDHPRVASMCTISDQVLRELIPAARIAAISGPTRSGPDGWRYSPGPTIRSDSSVEELLSLDADLLLCCSLGGRPEKLERAREAGQIVFDLGLMLGRATLGEQITQIAALVGEPDRGAALSQRWSERMDRVAADVPQQERPRALFLSTYADRFFGGAAGSSYHDLLETAGLIDMATEAGFRDWPAYDPETLLELDPALIVTRIGGREALCGHSQVGRVAACGPDGRVVEMDETRLGDPGLGMLEAAEELRRAVHGPRRGAPTEAPDATPDATL